MWIVIALWAVTLLTHVAYQWIEFTPARAFYVFRGYEGALLFLSMLWFIEHKPSRLQAQVVSTLAICGATWETLTAVCGAAWYWGKGPEKAPISGLMCDQAHGWEPVVWSMALVICGLYLWRRRENRS